MALVRKDLLWVPVQQGKREGNLAYLWRNKERVIGCKSWRLRKKKRGDIGGIWGGRRTGARVEGDIGTEGQMSRRQSHGR